MKKKNKFSKLYMKYFVKHGIFYYSYLVCFAIFIAVSMNYLQIDYRKEYPAIVKENSIYINQEKIPQIIDNQIVIYKNKTKKIWKVHIVSQKIKDRQICLKTSNEIKYVSGKVTIEYVTDRQSLLKSIFKKEGRTE